MPFSYAQYAGNGSATTFSVPFPYLLKAHVKLYTGYNILNGTFTSQLVDGVGYTWTSGTQVQTTVAPAVGVTLTILRDTPDTSQLVPWQDGSNLIADDLNSSDLQNLYVVQEQQDRNDAGITQSTSAITAANAATTASNTATSTANSALSTANTALSNSSAAISTANTAASNASAAVSTANTASSNASAAVSTANAASSTAGTAASNASAAVSTANAAAANATAAVSTANTASSNATAAVSTANTAASNATAAVSTANTAASNATAAVSTANTASSNASVAVSTANTAASNASNAVSTANSALSTANAASAAVASAVIYTPVVDLTALQALTPSDGDFFELQNSTGADTDPDITGAPVGLAGAAGLTFRLRYDDPPQEFVFLGYFANDSETRYLKLSGGTLTGQLLGDNSTSAATPGFAFDGDPNTGVLRPGADELALVTAGTSRLTIDSSGNVAVPGGLTRAGNNVVTVGDTGTVTSTMILDGTILNADINASAAIADTKLDTIATAGKVSNSATTATSANTNSAIVARDGSGNFSAGTITAALTGAASSNVLKAGDTMTGALVHPLGAAATPSITFTSDLNTGIYSPGADQVAVATNGVERLTTSTTAVTSTLPVVLPLGAAATPSLTFTGDLNAGIFSPAADQVAVATNGNQRLLVNGTGDVGIGIAAPSAKLHVGGGIWATNGELAGGNTASTGTDGTFRLLSSGGTNFFQFGQNRSSGSAAPLVFGSIFGGAEYMRITATGLVGIGTTSPAVDLDIANADECRVRVRATTSGVDTRLGALGLTGNVGIVGTYSNHPLVFFANNSERCRLDSSGRLLVGTSSSSAAASLVCQGTSASSTAGTQIWLQRGQAAASIGSGDTLGRINFADNAGNAYAIIEGATDASGGSGDYPGRLVFSTTADGASSPTERMRITNDGRVGIGTGSPSENLHLVSGNAAVVIENSAATSNATLQLKYPSRTWSIANRGSDLSGALTFRDITASEDRVLINSSGELLVGYTIDNGAYKLQVNSQIFATSSTIATSDGRYKENVATLGGCLNLVKALRPVSFTWKPQQDIKRIDEDGNKVLVREGHNFPDGTQVGFIAQEVQEVLAEKPWLTSVIKENVRPAVTDSEGNELAPEEEFLGIAEGNLIAVLTSALQEAIGKIEQLEAAVTALQQS